METKIGYFASLEPYKPGDASIPSVRAENTGFHSIRADDHTDARSGMGAALEATKNIFFSTCIASPVLRCN